MKLYSFKFYAKSNLMTLTLFLNLFLVLYLYSTIWKNIELGSAYRYIFSFINIYFIDFLYALEKSKKVLININYFLFDNFANVSYRVYKI